MIPIEIVGDGDETILAVHGGPGTDHRLFRPELDRLGEFARVVYFDLPGHGRSDPPQDYALHTMAQALEDVRVATGRERVTLLGSSYGGFLSLAYALAYPHRVTRLILVDTSASSAFRARSIEIARERATPQMLTAFERLWSGKLTGNDDFRENWRTLFPLYFAQSPADQIDAYARRTSYTLATRRAILPTFETYDLRSSLGSLTMPALVIVGAYDWITPPDEARALAQGLPNARLEVFTHSGHYPFLEEGERFIAVVKAFVHER